MTRTVRRRKVKKKSLLILFLILALIIFAVFYVFNFHITNIYISNNQLFTDQEIIDMAKLSNYPRTFNNNELVIKNRLEKNELIKKVTVRKKNLFREVYIDIEENTPLFIYQNKTVLKDGKKIDKLYDVPTLINEINDQKVYKKLLEKINDIDTTIKERISEIKYDPNKADKERFLMYMNDGNYVFITLRKINRINKYVDIISAFDNKKGKLYLDSGEYFEVFGGKNE